MRLLSGIIVLVLLMPLRMSAQTSAAWESMRLGKWDEALHKLEPLRNSQDVSEAASAWFAEGACWQYQRPSPDLARAAACYARVVSDYPDSPSAPWSLFALARIPDLEVLEPAPAKAIPIYREVREKYPASDAAQEASIHLALALWSAEGLEGAREGVNELREWKQRQPSKKYAAQIDLILGKLSRYPLKDYSQAVTHLRAALDEGLRSLPQRVTTCWTIAYLADHEVGDRETAIEYYRRFLTNFPQHKTSYMAKRALERLGAPWQAKEKAAP